MDLGSLLCVRGQPRCGECPMADGCVARAQGRQRALPTARPRKAQPLAACTVMLLARNAAGEVWLQRRPDSGVWGGLWSLPELADIGEAPALAGGGGLDSGAADAAVAHRAACVHPFRLDITCRRCAPRRAGLADWVLVDAGGCWRWFAGALFAGTTPGRTVSGEWRWRVRVTKIIRS